MWERFREGRKIASPPRRAGRGRHRKPTPSTWWVFRPLFILSGCRLCSPPTWGHRDGALSLPVWRRTCGVSVEGWGMQVEWFCRRKWARRLKQKRAPGWHVEERGWVWQPRGWWKADPPAQGWDTLRELHSAWTQAAEVTTAFGSSSEGVMCFGRVCHLTVLGTHVYSPIPWEASGVATPGPAFGTMRSTGCCTPQLLFWTLLRFDFKISVLMVSQDGLWMITVASACIWHSYHPDWVACSLALSREALTPGLSRGLGWSELHFFQQHKILVSVYKSWLCASYRKVFSSSPSPYHLASLHPAL